MDRALTTGRREDRVAVMKEWSWIGDDLADQDRIRLIDAYTDWCWRPRYCGAEFDFGDEANFRRGIDLFVEMVRKRYSRARPCTPIIARQHFGWWAMLYRLKAKVEIHPSPRKRSTPPAGTAAITRRDRCRIARRTRLPLEHRWRPRTRASLSALAALPAI